MIIYAATDVRGPVKYDKSLKRSVRGYFTFSGPRTRLPRLFRSAIRQSKIMTLITGRPIEFQKSVGDFFKFICDEYKKIYWYEQQQIILIIMYF